jgi:hypothetical protein
LRSGATEPGRASQPEREGAINHLPELGKMLGRVPDRQLGRVPDRQLGLAGGRKSPDASAWLAGPEIP